MASEELELTGDGAFRVASALASETCFRILHLLAKEKLDVSTIARSLGLSEAHISEEIGRLENLGLLKINYARGKRGIRKICDIAFGRIIIVIKP